MPLALVDVHCGSVIDGTRKIIGVRLISVPEGWLRQCGSEHGRGAGGLNNVRLLDQETELSDPKFKMLTVCE